MPTSRIKKSVLDDQSATCAWEDQETATKMLGWIKDYTLDFIYSLTSGGQKMDRDEIDRIKLKIRTINLITANMND